MHAAPDRTRAASADLDQDARGRRAGGRIRGVDLARAVAILGMLAVHVGPTDDTSIVGRLYAVPHGRASLLFALVAGVGVALMAGSPSRSMRRTRATLLWRAGLLLPAGLALQLLDHGVNVILQSYALLFLVAVVAVGLSDRWVLALAGLSALGGSALVLMGQVRWPAAFERDPLLPDQPVGELVVDLAVSGPYPAVTWSAPLLVGLWLGRRDLRAPRLRRWAIAAGGGVALACLVVSEVAQRIVPVHTGEATPAQVLLSTPHSQMPLWVIGGTASAVAVLGISLVVADRFPRLTHPLAATGTLALSVYVGHLLVLHAAPGLRADEVGGATLTLVGMGAALVLISTLWHDLIGDGPLERLLRLPRVPRLLAGGPHRSRSRGGGAAQTSTTPRTPERTSHDRDADPPPHGPEAPGTGPHGH